MRLDYPKLEEIVLEDTRPHQQWCMSMDFLHYLVDKWPVATIKLTQTFLLDSGIDGGCASEAFIFHGLPREGGVAGVTEKNPLVLPPPTDGTRGPCSFLSLFECFEDLKYGYE